ncbi:hypothetical protein TRFO_18241 [Tritrichomonas foetus]|uniref:protein-tyrosine-phosphatase n=1 Tax=Tritrichomonas foetus TaxID=1144522 RepID=A0A1J4KL74_9EUKA|nr:hypothetical protein TRFO_18241 [Tritrichomonas foetus]|eukprot:OHT12049.1 hypothetical protein TRFO_18241 [Tritrichomonas foetus]
MCLRVTCPHQNIEIVEDRVYFSILRRTPRNSQFVTYFTIDDEPKYKYRSFFDDFGPPSILQLTEFYRNVSNQLNESKQILHFYTSPNPPLCANAVMYISFFRMLYLKTSPEETYKPFLNIQKFIYDFRDASTAPSVFELKTIDVLRGIRKAMDHNWYDPEKFDSQKWQEIEALQNGDMNWLIPGKLMAFASPYSMPVLPSGDRVATPEVVIPTFKELGINHIVRLNKQYYDAEDFRKENFKHTELYFLDGSIPPTKILNQFLDIIESDDVVALHCKAGLGRTYVFLKIIMLFYISFYRFTNTTNNSNTFFVHKNTNKFFLFIPGKLPKKN